MSKCEAASRDERERMIATAHNSRSKINPTDGVRLQPTQLGRVALVISRVYLDEQEPGSDTLALILDREDWQTLAAQIRRMTSPTCKHRCVRGRDCGGCGCEGCGYTRARAVRAGQQISVADYDCHACKTGVGPHRIGCKQAT